MPKYEIMLIVDPKQITEADALAKEVLGSAADIKKLERTEMAYEINGTKVANYLVINVNTTGAIVKEFVRRANISKAIWRHLVVNLDSERAMKTMNAEPKRPYVRREDRRDDSRREGRGEGRNENSQPREEGAERRPFKRPYNKENKGA